MAMPYYICYKGKRYGEPMTKEEAANKMIRMRWLFEGLEIVEWIETKPSVPGGATDRRILQQTLKRANS